MRKIIILSLVLAVGITSKAQYSGYSPIADLAKFKADFSEATQRTTSIKSDFVQEKNLSMLSEKIISKGKFWFKKESQVRMEYSQPYQYLMILNKDKVFVKDDQK
jgi:outer membrane lipoprotein-sorting protein